MVPVLWVFTSLHLQRIARESMLSEHLVYLQAVANYTIIKGGLYIADIYAAAYSNHCFSVIDSS